MAWEMESQAHPVPLGGRVLSTPHRGGLLGVAIGTLQAGIVLSLGLH